MFTKQEVCEMLGISIHTLRTWYGWQFKLLKEGKIKKPYLPEPEKLTNKKGKPCVFSDKQIEQLKEYQHSIVHGRNGAYGMFSNPLHKETKKYKKQMEEQNV